MKLLIIKLNYEILQKDNRKLMTLLVKRCEEVRGVLTVSDRENGIGEPSSNFGCRSLWFK